MSERIRENGYYRPKFQELLRQVDEKIREAHQIMISADIDPDDAALQLHASSTDVVLEYNIFTRQN